MNEKDILAKLLLQEDERMETPPKTFEDDPMNFILNKYENLREELTYLMSENFEELITGIYILAYKPTTFKVVLHNGQYFFLMFMGKAYQATVAGKNYFLLTTGEKQRCMLAIARMLRYGSPLKVKGPEGSEQAATETGEATPEEAPPAESSETGGETGETETLAESKKKLQLLILKEAIKKSDSKTISRPYTGTNDTSLKEGLVCLFFDVLKNSSISSQIDSIYPKIIAQDPNLDKNKIKSICESITKVFNSNKNNYGSGKSMPENLDKYVEYVFLTGNEISTVTNAISAAKNIRKSINSNGQIIRNESFDKIRANAVKLAKDYNINLLPDNWCPGDVYLVVDKSYVGKAEKATSLNVGKDSLNSLFKKTDGLIAISLKEEKAQAGKATTFAKTVFENTFEAKLDPSEKYGTSDNKELAKLSANITRFEEYYYGKSKSGKRPQSYINALTKDGQIHRSVNNILYSAGLDKLKTNDIVGINAKNENQFYTKNKKIFLSIENAIKGLKAKLNQKDSSKKVKEDFVKSRNAFISDIKKYKVEVEAKNNQAFIKEIEEKNEDPVSVLSKKTSTYELASVIIKKWTDKNTEISPAYKKIQQMSNPFVALTAFAIAEAGISPSFWKVIGSSKDLNKGESHFFDAKATVDIDSKTSPIKLIDSPEQSGFLLSYITTLGKDNFSTKLVFRFSGAEIRIEVQELKKIK
jgi:hypothetical protein